jgi:hypothetical protein
MMGLLMRGICTQLQAKYWKRKAAPAVVRGKPSSRALLRLLHATLGNVRHLRSNDLLDICARCLAP